MYCICRRVICVLNTTDDTLEHVSFKNKSACNIRIGSGNSFHDFNVPDLIPFGRKACERAVVNFMSSGRIIPTDTYSCHCIPSL